MVNLAEFALRVFHDGQQVWVTRVVDGKPTMPTPIMSADMKYITVNPTWNVPPSIVHKEYLPALARDPTVLARAGLVVGRNSDGSVHIYQPPGEKNALGRLRFNFPNKFLVYQHDTPDKHFSPWTGGRSVTAACGCRIRRNTRRYCCRSHGLATAIPRSASARCSAPAKPTSSSPPLFPST